MPKYYCDYCDVFLTHDAPRVRRDHNTGWKHQAAIRTYFQTVCNQDKMARQVGEIIKQYEERREFVPIPVPVSDAMKPGMRPPSNMPLMMPGQAPLPLLRPGRPVGPMNVPGPMMGHPMPMQPPGHAFPPHPMMPMPPGIPGMPGMPMPPGMPGMPMPPGMPPFMPPGLPPMMPPGAPMMPPGVPPMYPMPMPMHGAPPMMPPMSAMPMPNQLHNQMPTNQIPQLPSQTQQQQLGQYPFVNK